jgi:ubiquinone/menaquinone biosynthesis C-methylase UbiE
MEIKDLRQDWDAFGRRDPLWAIITHPKKRKNRWDVSEFFETGVSEIRQLMDYVDSLGVPIPRKKALDFGCGVGRLSQALATYFEEVHGVDVAPSMIDLACRYNRYGDRCKYHLNDRSALALFGHDTFDLIYSNITLQHIDPIHSKRYIKEFVRILAPGGLLVFQLPSAPVNRVKARAKHMIATQLLWFSRRIGYIRRPIMVMHAIKREEVQCLLEESGARIVHVRENQNAGRDWLSYRYCATKPRKPAAS